ncbi:MAG: hypothetical protein BWY07_00116 [Candidatus Hydrogenedentes bacterium ADurb.Bin170]|nr:MAG: hypothetical protein BWY07_00116 [Candidatus Hydrogenedentes bacterium ADurb.Bin170]
MDIFKFDTDGRFEDFLDLTHLFYFLPFFSNFRHRKTVGLDTPGIGTFGQPLGRLYKALNHTAVFCDPALVVFYFGIMGTQSGFMQPVFRCLIFRVDQQNIAVNFHSCGVMLRFEILGAVAH